MIVVAVLFNEVNRNVSSLAVYVDVEIRLGPYHLSKKLQGDRSRDERACPSLHLPEVLDRFSVPKKWDQETINAEGVMNEKVEAAACTSQSNEFMRGNVTE